ncbi:hypothetical protein FJ977_32550 [Mesorhizobium sp. B2-1-3A]|nr:hypothetical protein FJ977_32550 [Mesorhizobium sp. B2-1-3A]
MDSPQWPAPNDAGVCLMSMRDDMLGADYCWSQRPPSSGCRHFVVRKAKQLAFRPLRGPLLNSRKRGEGAAVAGFANRQHCRRGARRSGQLLSPRLRGEMPGRAMRGSADARLLSRISAPRRRPHRPSLTSVQIHPIKVSTRNG